MNFKTLMRLTQEARARDALPSGAISSSGRSAMKALTLYPTWAVLIAIEAKRYETRSWPTNYRGPIAITCSARITDDDRACFYTESYFPVLSAAGFKDVRDLPLGCVICTALLTQVLPTAEIVTSISEQERAFGCYDPGRHAWQLEGVERLNPVIPCVGNRQLWDIDIARARQMAKDGLVFSSREPKKKEADLFTP